MSDNVLPYIIRKIGDREVKLAKLSPRDRGAVLARLKAEARERLRANLKESSVDKEQIFGELMAFDDRKWAASQFVDYCNTTEGENALCAMAWKKQNGDGDAWPDLDAIAAENDGSLFSLLLEVCNLTPKTPETKPETTGPNPPAPATGDPMAGQAYGK